MNDSAQRLPMRHGRKVSHCDKPGADVDVHIGEVCVTRHCQKGALGHKRTYIAPGRPAHCHSSKGCCLLVQRMMRLMIRTLVAQNDFELHRPADTSLEPIFL